MPKRKKPMPFPTKGTNPSGPPINPFPKPQPENALTPPKEEDDDDLEEFVKNHGRLP